MTNIQNNCLDNSATRLLYPFNVIIIGEARMAEAVRPTGGGIVFSAAKGIIPGENLGSPSVTCPRVLLFLPSSSFSLLSSLLF